MASVLLSHGYGAFSQCSTPKSLALPHSQCAIAGTGMPRTVYKGPHWAENPLDEISTHAREAFRDIYNIPKAKWEAS